MTALMDAYPMPSPSVASCDAGHDHHRRVTVHTSYGLFTVYDWEHYAGTVGYCTGNCAVSETIVTQHQWERFGTALMLDVLRSGDPDTEVVLDFGANVGWYTVIAADAGYQVAAWESDIVNVETLQANAVTHECSDRIEVVHAWVDERLPALTADAERVRFMKVDIEGNDRHAVHAARSLFERRRVDAAMIEISPVFNDTYPDLVEWICGCGYDVCWVPDGSFPHLDEFFDNPVAHVRERCAIPAEGRRELVAGLHQADFLFLPTGAP